MRLEAGRCPDPAIPSLWLTLCLSKVADCICLMALDKPQAVPVDVHVWQIAQRDYSWYPTKTQAKGPSPQANKELGNFFRSLWGPYAGWAQAVSIPRLPFLFPQP